MIENVTDSFAGHDGLKLFRQKWLPDTPAKATLIIVHGVGEHSGRYVNVVNHLVPLGYALYGYDHRGHGQSGGKLGHIDSWADYREDLGCFVTQVQQEIKDQPLFILGHSMGGLVTLDYLLHYPQGIAGTIISAPALDRSEAPAVFVLLAKLLNLIAPGLQLSSPLNTEAISRDPQAVQAYIDDPLNHNKVTPRWTLELFKTMDWVQAHAADFTLPILLTHSEKDKIVPIGGTKQFFSQITAPDKQFIIYPDSRHEPHNDLNHQEVVENMAAWLVAHR